MFRKEYEVYSPADLCWLQVSYQTGNKAVHLRNNKGEEEIGLCDGSPHQLDEMIALLQHLRDTYYPATEPAE